VGAPGLIARFVPAATPHERAALARALFRRLARRRAAQFVGLVVAAGALIMIAPATFDPIATTLVVTGLGLDLAATLCFQLALGLGRDRVWSLRYPFQNGFLTLAAVPLGLAAGGYGAITAVVLASGGALVVGAASVVPMLREAESGATVPPALLRFGAQYGASSLLFLITHRGGVVMVAAFAGAAEAGFAALALGVALAVLASVWQLFLLQLSVLSERADAYLEEAERQAERLAGQVLAFLVTTALLGGLVLQHALVPVFGEAFRSAERAFIPVLGLLPLVSLTALANQIAALRLQPEVRLHASAFGLGVFLLTAPVAVAEWGAVGATGALLASTAVALVVFARELPMFVSKRVLATAAAGSAGAMLIALTT
jgi:O-antigen/teichoic acid export membrane protein